MAEDLVSLDGSVPPNRHPRIGDVDPKERIEVTLKLRRQTEDGLPTLQEFIAGKRAKISRHDLLDRYGTSRADAAAIESWATGQSLSVSSTNLGLREMHLVGSAAAMSRAFGVTLSRHRHLRTGTIFHSHDGAVRVPRALAPIITGVFGLDDRPVVVRNSIRFGRRAMAATDPKQQFPGSFYPDEVAKLYQFPPTTTGTGQRVAILEFGGGFDQSALNSYFTQNLGLSKAPTVNALFVLGSKMDIGDGATGEVYLDIEVVGGMAPDAVMDVYFAPWSSQGYLNAIDQAIHSNDYAAISISYGLDEDLRSTSQNPGWSMLNKNVDEGFRDASAIGVPLFVSSGDQGSSSARGQLANQQEITILAPNAHAGYPATSPYATAVGGTMLYAANGTISNEVVWNELGQVQTGQFYGELGEPQEGQYYIGAGTGGGVSDHYPAPSYQISAGIDLQSANTPPVKGRSVPDVAGNAGMTTGYLVTQPPGSQLPIAPVGGTSAAAPMWAALMACVREGLNTTFAGNIPVFFLNDFIYACGKTAAFRDIVGGREVAFDSNGAPVPGDFIPVGNNQSSVANGYTASEGYDLCTGWGSPNGVALLDQLTTWLRAQPPAA